MAGVREKKQKETRARIMLVARELFSEKGYEGTTVEQIAEQAVVGVGTLYNYFPSKDDIFLSVMSEEILLNVEEGDPDEDGDRAGGAEEALMKYLSRSFKTMMLFGKGLWRDMCSMTLGKSNSALFKKVAALDMRFVASLEKRLEGYKKNGYLPESFDCGEAAFNIYSVMMTLFLLYVYTDEMTMDDLTAKVRKQVRFIFFGRG